MKEEKASCCMQKRKWSRPPASFPAAWTPRRPEASLTLETPEVRAAGSHGAASAAPTHARHGDCLERPCPG